MKLLIQTLHKKDKNAFNDFYTIYSISFVLSEQKSKEELFTMLNSPHYTIFISKYKNKIVAFCIIFHALESSFYLLEYMAVYANERGLGIGSKLFSFAIEEIYNNYGIKPFLIEIDSPEQMSDEQEIRQKREHFYKRLGCRKIDTFDYILAIQNDQTVPPMELLVYHSTMQNILKPQLQEWLEDIYILVYNNHKEDARIAKMLQNAPPVLNLI